MCKSDGVLDLQVFGNQVDVIARKLFAAPASHSRLQKAIVNKNFLWRNSGLLHRQPLIQASFSIVCVTRIIV